MSSIKELVKKHFNLIDASTHSFGELKTADGQLTLSYEGEELSEGLDVFVVTADGNVPAPDGDHALESGVTISVAEGKITAITESPIVAEETVVETEMAEDVSMPETAVAEEVIAAVSEEVAAVVEEAISEEVVAAVTEAVSAAVSGMMNKMEERMVALEGKFSTFASAPATEKTIAGSSSTTKFNSDKLPSRNQVMIDNYIALKNKK